jgi:hypothetical protein
MKQARVRVRAEGCGALAAGGDPGPTWRRTMPSHDLDTLLAWRGSTVRDRDGDKIGTLKELYLDQDDRPAWGAVDTGLFGLRQSFVPLADATAVDDDVQIPFDKDHVKSAPNVDPDAQLSEDEERRLYRHYELPAPAEEEGAERADAGEERVDARAERVDAGAERGDAGAERDDADADPGAERADAGAERADDDADERPTAERPGGGDDDAVDDEAGDADRDREPPDAMTRSEEEVTVGTRRRVRGKARLRKYVVTEHVQRTVPVQREEVRVEYEPADGEDAQAGERPAE